MRRAPPHEKRAAERRGRVAEWLALGLFLLKGYRLVRRRYRAPVGEVDLIVARRGALVFVEVKARRDASAAAYSVSLRQQRRISRAALWFLARHPRYGGWRIRFDVVLQTRGIRHIPNAFPFREG